MLELISENSVLRAATLLALFVVVVVGAYFAAASLSARQSVRQRLVDPSIDPGHTSIGAGSLRSRSTESTWLKMVAAIEKSGLSLVDTKDEHLRQRLAAAGYAAPYAPRVYTLIR